MKRQTAKQPHAILFEQSNRQYTSRRVAVWTTHQLESSSLHNVPTRGRFYIASRRYHEAHAPHNIRIVSVENGAHRRT